MNGKFAKTEISLLSKRFDPDIYISSSVINVFTFISSINVKSILFSKRKTNSLTSSTRLSY